ncbi:hypothetical protein Gotur_002885 [Gossypium turneri]
MVKVPFVVFSLALVLSIQFVVGQDEKALDEAASPKAEDVLLSSEVAKLVENLKALLEMIPRVWIGQLLASLLRLQLLQNRK